MIITSAPSGIANGINRAKINSMKASQSPMEVTWCSIVFAAPSLYMTMVSLFLQYRSESNSSSGKDLYTMLFSSTAVNVMFIVLWSMV